MPFRRVNGLCCWMVYLVLCGLDVHTFWRTARQLPRTSPPVTLLPLFRTYVLRITRDGGGCHCAYISAVIWANGPDVPCGSATPPRLCIVRAFRVFTTFVFALWLSFASCCTVCHSSCHSLTAALLRSYLPLATLMDGGSDWPSRSLLTHYRTRCTYFFTAAVNDLLALPRTTACLIHHLRLWFCTV